MRRVLRSPTNAVERADAPAVLRLAEAAPPALCPFPDPLRPPRVCKPYSVRGIMRKNAIPFIRRNEVRRIFRIFAVPEQDFPATPEQAIVIPASGIPNFAVSRHQSRREKGIPGGDGFANDVRDGGNGRPERKAV